jgi:hypothetical protein
VVEIFAFEILHHEIGLAGFGLSEVHDAHQVRVPEAGCDLGLAMEPGQSLAIGSQLTCHELDGHALVETKLNRLVHCAHTAFADETRDAVRPSEHGSHECIHARFRRHGRILLRLELPEDLAWLLAYACALTSLREDPPSPRS